MKPKALERVEKILCRAEKEKRNDLLEHEVYDLLKCLGFQTPRFIFIRNFPVNAMPLQLAKIIDNSLFNHNLAISQHINLDNKT